MSDSEASLPLPSPADSGGGDIDDKGKTLGHDTDGSNSDSGSSPGKIPTPSTPKDGRDSMSLSSTLLEDIPYPTDADTSQVPNQDHDDIPLPPDSSRYSPSQVTPGDDENESMMSPSESTESNSLDKKPSTVTMKVLGSAQAKKRLLAFSASKQAAVSYSPLSKKISPLKGVSVFHQAASKKEITKEQTLAIASIKEEETKMKEILAMNSILNEKLKQVKSITENIPKAPPITAVVNPTVVTSENFRISDISSKLNEEEIFSKKSSSANPRNLRKKRSSSSSRSRSRSHSVSKSPSLDSKNRKRDKHSRSRSRDRGRDRDRRDRDRSDRERIREKEKKSRKSRSRSRSPKIKKEKKRSKSHSRSPKHKTRDKDKSRKRSKSRSHSRDHGRKRSPKSEKKDYDSRDRDRERSRQKDKERELEREKEKERERKENERKREEDKKREREEAAERELDKVRKVRMPYDWPDYEVHQYRPADIHKLWGAMVIKSSRSKSPTQSDAKGSNPSKEVQQPTPLSKTLNKQLKSMNVITVETAAGGTIDYPTAFVKNTRSKPPITYGVNTLTYLGYYKSRQQVFKDEEADIMHAMSEIISQKGAPVTQFPSSSDVWKSKKKQQEWFAQTDQIFCPSEGSKGIVISHLYSDDEGDDSPAGSLKIRKPLNVNDRNIDSTPVPVLQQKSPSSPDSMDSAPSPLLKKKYNSDDPSGKDNFEPDKELAHKDEPRKRRDHDLLRNNSSNSSDEEGEHVRGRDRKKSEKVPKNLISDEDKDKGRNLEKLAEIESKSKKSNSTEDKVAALHPRRSENKDASPKIQDDEDDDMYEEMELEDFPLEKEIVANSKSGDKDKKDKDKHKSKESKDKSKKAKKQKKKKKHHKSKDKQEKKKSSDEEEDDVEGPDSSDADSARLKTPKKSSKKDKAEKIPKEKRHRKRRSKTESSKGSESSSGSDNTDDSSKKRPKKKRSKLLSNEDIPVDKSVDTKKSSKSSTHEPQVAQPIVEKEKSRKEKKKKHDKSKSKKKHSRKNRDSSSSSSTESSASDSTSSSDSSSDSSDEESDDDRKAKKSEKKKKAKKDRKESKKDKGRDKTPDTSDDENHGRRGGGRRDDRGGGGAGGFSGGSGRSSGGHFNKDYRDRDRDHSYRDRGRDRDRGDKRGHYGRRRVNGEFGELFDSLGDWNMHNESFQPQGKENESLIGLSPKVKEIMKEPSAPATLRHVDKQAQELLTAIDNDLLLQSVLMNEDLSAETLLKQITEPVESERPTVGSKPVFSLPVASVPSNWSDDSEEENAAVAEKADSNIPQSSGYGTEISTDSIVNNASDEKSDASDSSSDDSTDSESSSSSSDSQSDSDSINAKEKTDLPEVKESASKSTENSAVPSQVHVLYDPFADNSDATSGSSDSEKKGATVKDEKLDNITREDVYKEDNKFYEDLKNTMDVLTKYENKVDTNLCSDTKKQLESTPIVKEPCDFPGKSPKISETVLDKGTEVSPTKLLNFKISGSKLDKSNLTAFGTEENTEDLKSPDLHSVKSVSQKKEKTIPVITSKDHSEQFPISVLGSTCNKIAPIPNVSAFTEEHINLGSVDNYTCDTRENHERSRYVKQVPTLRSRSRSYSRSPSRSRSRSFSPHRRYVTGAPLNNRFHTSVRYERDRALGRSRRRSPPPEMYFHGRRQYAGDRRRHYHHQGHPDDITRRRERDRFRRPMSRSKSRSRSRSRSMSRSRSRSISPRSGFHRSRRIELVDRRGRGHYFDPRDQRDNRRYLRERDYHDRERSRTPEDFSPTEMRMRKKHCGFDDRLPHEDRDRIPLKDRGGKLLVTENDRDLVPVAQKQESPPLQLNVADSTISDSELASRNAINQTNPDNIYIGGISREMLIDHHNSGHMELPHPLEAQLHIGHHHPQEPLDNDMCSDYNSPPRRLSLDERLEMEMGISLRDEPVNKVQQIPGGYYYPPAVYRMPGQEHPDQGKYLPVLPHSQPIGVEHGHHPGAVPGTWNTAGKGFVPGKPLRAQSQIVQVGNVIQVVPADIPIVPITITASSKSRRSSERLCSIMGSMTVPNETFPVATLRITDFSNRDFSYQADYFRRDCSNPNATPEEMSLQKYKNQLIITNKRQSVPKRVVTIKVPVVPFSVPIMQPEDMIQMQPPQLTEEENNARERRKNRRIKKKKRLAAELAKKRNTTIGEEEDVTPGDNKEEESQGTSPKENSLLKSGETQPDVENDKASLSEDGKNVEESKSGTPADQSPSSAPKDGGELNLVEENKDVPVRPPPRKIEILPPPNKGILVAAGFREKTLDENNEKIIKGVKFADGINPGCGTSSSEGEEMASPPPPSEMNAVHSSRKSKMLRKKKIKVKIVRKVEEKKETEEKTENTETEPEPEPEPENQPPPPPPSPPPCPSSAYPFCPPGILYQVCSQYAVLYAQAMAEKGIDIVFQPSTQIPTMGENLILSDTLGESGLEAPENIDFQVPESSLATTHQTSYEHTSNIPSLTESPEQTTGSRIPTIIRTSNSPPILDYEMDKSDCNLMINPMSSEILDNTIRTTITRNRIINKNIVEVPIVDMDSMPNNLLQPVTDFNLDEIPLPMAISPSKIPVPAGTPPLSFHISSKPKKYRKSNPNNRLIPSVSSSKLKSKLSTPTFLRSASTSNIVVTPTADQIYDYHPYSLHTESQCLSQSSSGLSPGSAQVSISVSAPPHLMPTIPPGVDLSRPPPSFTPPPPGTIDFSDPSTNSAVASALGISRYSTDHTF